MIKRALFLATAERYITIVINLITIAVVARILTPTEFGASVLGIAALTIVGIVREFGASSYLIKVEKIENEHIQTVFTITMILTLILSALVYLSSPWIEELYGIPGLGFYFQIMTLSMLLGPIVTPPHVLMRREMQFGKIAIVGITALIVNSLTTIVLAAYGFSFMSFAWAGLISGIVGLALTLYFRGEFEFFKPSLREWRSFISFGRYDTAASALATVWEHLPFLILGLLLNAGAVGLFQRAMTLCALPKRALLGGVASIILPALAVHTREGGCLKDAYLRGVNLITAVHWPSLALLALLAYPVVAILLGPQWKAVVPLTQIIACALMINFSMTLTYSTLVVAGAVKDAFLLNLLVVPLSIAFITFAAYHSITAVAFAMFAAVLLEISVSIYMLRKNLGFTYSELFAVMRSSAIVTLLSALGPLLIIVLSGMDFQISITTAILVTPLILFGWFAGIWWTQHPLLDEVGSFLETTRPTLSRLRSKIASSMHAITPRWS